MSMFRAKKLDLGCFVNVRTLRDHTKRKVFEQHETERCANSSHSPEALTFCTALSAGGEASSSPHAPI